VEILIPLACSQALDTKAIVYGFPQQSENLFGSMRSHFVLNAELKQAALGGLAN